MYNEAMRRVLLAALVSGLLLALAAFAPRPRVAAAPDPIAGNVKSPVRVIIYQDLECPDCARWHGIFETQIIPRYGARVGFEFRDFPLPQHLWSFNAAVLARYFDTRNLRIGMAWRDYCFTHQNELTPDNLLDAATAWARPYGVTRAELAQAFDRTDLFALVQADQARGKQDDVKHTPTILFDGVEAATPDELEQRLNAALSAPTARPN